MNFVKGKNLFDVDECLKNRAACFRNFGVACMGFKFYGEVIEYLFEYLCVLFDDVCILCCCGCVFVGCGDFVVVECDFVVCFRLDSYDVEFYDEFARFRDARCCDCECLCVFLCLMF